MPDSHLSPPRDYFHGSLNLEQQKKRAKELRRAADMGDAPALARVHAVLRTATAGQIQLSDAQLVIARENGFDSWPKLKAHCDSLAEQKRLQKAGLAGVPDTAETIHIRCGSDIRHGLTLAGFVGEFVEYADPFCQGPVRDLPPDAFRRERARFVADAYGLEFAEIRARQDTEYAALKDASERTDAHIVLWFEHDSYDQLILAYLLNHFAEQTRATTLELISVSDVPGVHGFVGLGQLAPEILRWLWDHRRRPVLRDQLEAGRCVWQAVIDPDPARLLQVAADGLTCLPHMAGALMRHLQELPSLRNGLSLTQQLTLEIIAEKGPLRAGAVFRELMTRREPLPFLGDLMFWHVLVDMGQSSHPPFTCRDKTAPWPERTLDITRAGTNLLEGKADYLDTYTSERWVGPVRIGGRPSTGSDYRWTPSGEGGMAIIRK